MSTTLLSLAVDEIGPHPKNVRRDDTPDPELIASVEAQGILQPLVVVPAPDDADSRYWLIMGHRRLAAALAARLDEVPAIVREDLPSEAEQIEAMLVENGRRQDLTAVEEADAYEQLTLLGESVVAISKATGRTAATVRKRLKIAGMAEKAKEALHAHQITLEHAESLADLEEDHELYSKAIAAIGTNNFRWELDHCHRVLERNRLWAERLEALKSAGMPEVEQPEGGWGRDWIRDDDDKPITLYGYATDQGTPGVDFDGYTIASNGEPVGVISVKLRATRAAAADDEPETDEQREAREKREREDAELQERRQARAEQKERHEAARTVREQSIRDAFATVKLTKAQAEILRAVMPAMLSRLEAQPLLVDRLGLEHDGNVWSIGADEIAVWLERKPAVELLAILTIAGVSELEDQYDTEHLDPAAGYDRPVLDAQLAYLDALETTKHPWSEPDAEWRAAVIERIDGADEDEADEA